MEVKKAREGLSKENLDKGVKQGQELSYGNLGTDFSNLQGWTCMALFFRFICCSLHFVLTKSLPPSWDCALAILNYEYVTPLCLCFILPLWYMIFTHNFFWKLWFYNVKVIIFASKALIEVTLFNMYKVFKPVIYS